jgi:hypothetical protein
MIDVIRKGMRVKDVDTGRIGKVVAHVKWDRHYIRVRFPNGRELVYEGTRELVKP